MSLIAMLRTHVADTGEEWDRFMPSVIFAYRATVRAALGDSPFYLVYNRDPVLPVDLLIYGGRCPQDPDEQFIWKMSQNLQESWNLAHLCQAQDQLKARFDRSVDEDRLREGDVVEKRIHLHTTCEICKLALKFTAGYRVMEVNPPNVKIVSLCKRRDPAEVVHSNDVKVVDQTVLDS